MASYIKRPSWFISDNGVTPESAWRSRRQFIREMGLGVAAMGSFMACGTDDIGPPAPPTPTVHVDDAPRGPLYPARRNPKYADGGRTMTEEAVAAKFNNFYEFSMDKKQVSKLVGNFRTDPWSVDVTGLVARPRRLSFEDILAAYDLEERVYRFRCVEAWAMTVPWTGFPLRKLIEKVKPKSSARYVRLWTVADERTMPGIKKYKSWGYNFPYYEAISMDEATNDMTLLATGIYGHELPAQHGAPIRLIVPWKYGFKSIKSIVRIDFVARRPKTFWNSLVPAEYDFVANVNPNSPHPRWSQATERMIGSGNRIPTQAYNGYAEQVAHLYRRKKG